MRVIGRTRMDQKSTNVRSLLSLSKRTTNMLFSAHNKKNPQNYPLSAYFSDILCMIIFISSFNIYYI